MSGPSEFVVPDTLTGRAIIEAVDRAWIVTSPDGEILLWNRAAAALYGWTEAEVLGRSISDVLVPAAQRELADGIMSLVASGEPWRGDFTVSSRTGEPVRVFVTNSPILDTNGDVVGIVGVSEDVTEQRLLERRAEDLAARLGLALEAGGFGTWRWNMQTGETEWDTKLEELFGLGPGEFDGTFDAYVALLHPEETETILETVREAVEKKSSYVVNHRVIWPDGTVHWLQGKGRVILDEGGEVIGTIGCTGDVTDQTQLTMEREALMEAALQAAENERVSRERLEFLGRINDALSAAANRDEVMRNVTRVAVPRLGDWCAIFVLPETDSLIPEVEVAHSDPKMIAFANDLMQRFPYDPEATSGIPAVIRSGRAEFIEEINEQRIQKYDVTEEARDAVRDLALGSAIAVPLIKHGRILGAMQFVNLASSRRYTDDDLALTRAVAARIASSLENVRLNEQQRMIATTLQASLLPQVLPEIPGLDLAVRYWATGEGMEVGGDFYDVFDVDDGWAVVIGDVCGTGPSAASLTGLARHTIRASAWHGTAHNGVLRHVNNAVLRSGRTTFCTALYGTLTRAPEGFTLNVASGGHPLPIVRRTTGETEILGEPGTLLGVFADSQSVTVSTELRPGDAVVLYTDGITDVRPPHDLTTDSLREIVARAGAASSATEIAERLGSELSAILPFAKRGDDIALLVLRVSAEARA
jgi:PAS domain S-box-containing protein